VVLDVEQVNWVVMMEVVLSVMKMETREEIVFETVEKVVAAVSVILEVVEVVDHAEATEGVSLVMVVGTETYFYNEKVYIGLNYYCYVFRIVRKRVVQSNLDNHN
jgi:hypothetical protein